jgi:hypothetical protein
MSDALTLQARALYDALTTAINDDATMDAAFDADTQSTLDAAFDQIDEVLAALTPEPAA